MAERASTADAFFLELDRHPEYISTMAVLYQLDDAPTDERLRRTLESLAVGTPRLRCVARRDRRGTWEWHEQADWSAGDVLRETTLAEPGPAALLSAIALAYQRPWEEGKPLWDCTILRGPSATWVLLRGNHALGDGLYFISPERPLLETEPAPEPVASAPAPTPAPEPVASAPAPTPLASPLSESLTYARYITRVLRGNHRRVGVASTDRALGTVRIGLDEWKKEAASRNGRINSLFLGVIGAILTRYFRESHHRELPHVNVVMPVDLRSGSRDEGNVAMRGEVLLPPLASVPDDLADIERIVREAREPKNLPVGPRAARFQERLPAVVRRPLVYRTMLLADTVGSNLRYPIPPVSFAGRSVQEFYAIAPASGNPVTFCLDTYADHIHVTINVDIGLAPNPAELFSIAEDVITELWPQGEVQHPWSEPSEPGGG